VSFVTENVVQSVVLKSTLPSPVIRIVGFVFGVGVDGRGEEGYSVCLICLEKVGRGDDERGRDLDGNEMVHHGE
jgi:hypothetical protein